MMFCDYGVPYLGSKEVKPRSCFLRAAFYYAYIPQVRLERKGSNWVALIQSICLCFIFETSSYLCVYTRFHHCLLCFVLFIFSFSLTFFLLFPSVLFSTSLFSEVEVEGGMEGGAEGGQRGDRGRVGSTPVSSIKVHCFQPTFDVPAPVSVDLLPSPHSCQGPHVRVRSH